MGFTGGWANKYDYFKKVATIFSEKLNILFV